MMILAMRYSFYAMRCDDPQIKTYNLNYVVVKGTPAAFIGRAVARTLPQFIFCLPYLAVFQTQVRETVAAIHDGLLIVWTKTPGLESRAITRYGVAPSGPRQNSRR